MNPWKVSDDVRLTVPFGHLSSSIALASVRPCRDCVQPIDQTTSPSALGAPPPPAEGSDSGPLTFAQKSQLLLPYRDPTQKCFFHKYFGQGYVFVTNRVNLINLSVHTSSGGQENPAEAGAPKDRQMSLSETLGRLSR